MDDNRSRKLACERAAGRLAARLYVFSLDLRGNDVCNHKCRLTLPNSKDVPQFSSNFTVYVLPPDTVCIYSEDRQFFLHGELDCALASAIGTEGRSYRDLVRELEPDCACEKVMEAMKRLFHRGYIIGTSHEAPSRPWQLIGQALAWRQKSQREIFGDVVCPFNRLMCGVKRSLVRLRGNWVFA
jgi:hypothetical protein